MLLSFCRLLGAILFLLDGIIRCNQFTYSVRMSLMGNVSNDYEHAKRPRFQSGCEASYISKVMFL